MQSWVKSSVSILLGIMFMLSGGSFSLAKMVCLKSGNSVITVNTPDDCCAHEHEHAPVTIEERCCDISNLNVDALHFLVSSSSHFEKAVTCAALPVYLNSYTAVQFTAEDSAPLQERIPDVHAPSIRILTKSFQV